MLDDSSTPATPRAIAPVQAGGRPALWAATGRLGGVSRAPFDALNLASHVGDEPSAVDRNRESVRALLGADGLSVVSAEHGNGVAVVTGPGDAPVADALISQTPGLAVMALGADCATVALSCDDDRTVAVIHCGWRGLVLDVVGETVGALAALGTRVSEAVAGPAICGTCYGVAPDRVAAVGQHCSGVVASAALPGGPAGRATIDVRAGVVARLVELGVAPTRLTLVGGCTQEAPGLFSHRRDGITGRQGLAIVRSRGTVVS